MPTAGRGQVSAPLTATQAQEKLSNLIKELPTDETTEAPAPAESEPEAPQAETPPEATPPQTSEPEVPAPEGIDAETVDVDGEPVTVAELKKDRLRQADYTRKTQALAEERKTLRSTIEAEVQAQVTQTHQQYVQGLQTITQALEKIQGEPNWVQLRKELPPEQYLERKADWEAQRAELEQLKAHQRDEAQKLEAEQAKQYEAWRRQERDKLLQAVPEWSDNTKAKAEWTKLVETAKAYGFQEEHVQQVADHRIILLLRDAAKWRESHREPTVKPKTPPIRSARPGTPERPRPSARAEQLIANTKSGRQRDAQKAIEAMIGDE